MNSVACSPGSPLKRTIGFSTQSMSGVPAAAAASCSHVIHQQHDAEMRDRNDDAVDRAVAGALAPLGRKCADIWCPKGSKSTQVVGRAADLAAEDLAIEIACFLKIANRKGKVKGRHVSIFP